MTPKQSVREDELKVPSDLRSPEMAMAAFISVRLDWVGISIERQTRALLDTTCGFSSLEWRCLATLCAHGPQTGAMLADLLHCNQPQISRSLRSLEGRGHVARPSGSARRGFGAVEVAEAGWAVYRRVKPTMQARNLWILDDFDEPERDQLYRLIARLRDRMAQAPDGDALLEDDRFRSLLSQIGGTLQAS